MATKYPISEEFKPYSNFVMPINRFTITLSRLFLRVPRFFLKDKDAKVEKYKITSFDGKQIEVYLITPNGITEPAPCLFNFHGGGFVIDGAKHHYQLALKYAKDLNCKVVYTRYRLAPKHPFPVAFEDAYSAFCWAYDHSKELGIDRKNLGVGGDSAGGTLSASLCIMARDRNHPVKFKFQMLSYPFLDGRCSSRSSKRFTDVPMWNSQRSKAVTPLFMPDINVKNALYASPVQTKSLEGLPAAYIETAEFDSLRDDGILYSKRLRRFGVNTELNQTKGTMHGFDICFNAPKTQDAISRRINFMQNHFA